MARSAVGAGVAHEINNPLGILAGFAEGLLDRSTIDAGRRACVQRLSRVLAADRSGGRPLKSIVQRSSHFARSRTPQKQLIDVIRRRSRSWSCSATTPGARARIVSGI